MSKRYPGGLINRSAPVVVGPVDGEGGSAPGVWTLEQAAEFKKQGLWPMPVISKGLWLWGFNGYGLLGLGDVTNRSSPVQVGALTTWSKISCFSLHTTATKTDGTLWSWGYNNAGQLGQGDITHRSSPVQVGALTTWSNIAGGDNHTTATRTDGTLWSWGYNANGQLGLGDGGAGTNRSSPVQVGALTTWSKIAGAGHHNIAFTSA